MKFSIKHEINGRFRIHVFQKGVMSLRQADLLQYYLGTLPEYRTQKFMNGLQTQLLFIKVTGMRSWKGSGLFLMKIKN